MILICWYSKNVEFFSIDYSIEVPTFIRAKKMIFHHFQWTAVIDNKDLIDSVTILLRGAGNSFWCAAQVPWEHKSSCLSLLNKFTSLQGWGSCIVCTLCKSFLDRKCSGLQRFLDVLLLLLNCYFSSSWSVKRQNLVNVFPGKFHKDTRFSDQVNLFCVIPIFSLFSKSFLYSIMVFLCLFCFPEVLSCFSWWNINRTPLSFYYPFILYIF